MCFDKYYLKMYLFRHYFNIIFCLFFRSSITRLSVDDKAERSKAVSSQERDLLLHKTIEERKGKRLCTYVLTIKTWTS